MGSPERKKPVALNREPLASQVARHMQTAIMNGEYALGEHLVEADLAETYRISRHVVREALQVLEGQGLVVSDPFCGRSVVHFTPKEIEGLLVLRVSLESAAAALAAYKINSDDRRRLTNHAALPAKGSWTYLELLERDFSIHREIWRIADEPALTQNLEKLLWPFMRALPLLEIDPADHQTLVDTQLRKEREGDPGGHSAVIDAICRQDSAAARHHMIVHLVSSGVYSRETSAAIQAAFGVRMV